MEFNPDQRFLLAGLLLIALATVAGAQDRSSNANDRDARLAMYLRVGRYADARRLIDQMLRTAPRNDLKNVRDLFGNGPNMRVRRHSASFPCEVRDDGVLLPLTVNGTRVNWVVDTGANVTIISDAEASRLGLVIRHSEGRARDLAGGDAVVRTAIVPHMVIGRTQLDDVPFLIMPADQKPWKEWPPGEQGIIGLPVAIALEALRWTRAGRCHTGSAAVDRAAAAAPNLRYDNLNVITTVEFEGKSLEFVLDTGNGAGTQLWERFGKDFEALVKERGNKGTVRVTQIGGAADRDTIVVPDVRMKVGGKETTLARANIFSKPVGNDLFHGLLGMDVLSQAGEVTIDFRSMSLTLR